MSLVFKQICQPDNFMYLNCKNVIHPHNETNFDKMKKKLQENEKIF